jgi:dienelactone hydrolase
VPCPAPCYVRVVLSTALLAAALLAPQDATPANPLHDRLARAVDLPTAAARAEAAAELAKTAGVTLAQWTAACASFGTFAPLEPGPSRHDVELEVDGELCKLELFLYVPPGYDPAKPAPLLLWGHGAGGTGAREHLQWQAIADALGMLVLAPTSVDREPGYHFSPRERAAHLAALRWARRRVNVDENAVFAGGWSQGGHLTWDVILRHPDHFAGALPVVGGPRLEPGPKCNLRYLENVAHLPIRDLQGSQDDERLLANLRLAFARLGKLGAKDAKLVEFADRGHDADLAAVDWRAFFAVRRTPVPARVVRLAADPAETRAHWLELVGWSQRAAPGLVPDVAAGYDTMDDARQRAHVLDRYAEHTARVAIEHKGGGRFVADGKAVSAFALLLVGAQLGKDGAVEIRLKDKPVRKKAVPDAAVLLREFVERFDRTFLPVARVTVP